jgi:hypothetical protein
MEPFGLDDSSLFLCVGRDPFRLIDTRDVHGIGADLLELAAAHVFVEQRGLSRKDLEHPLVDAVLGQETMHIDGPRVSDPMTPRYRLLLDRRLPLWLGQEYERGRLDVEADTPSLDLADENARGRRPLHHDAHRERRRRGREKSS